MNQPDTHCRIKRAVVMPSKTFRTLEKLSKPIAWAIYATPPAHAQTSYELHKLAHSMQRIANNRQPSAAK